MIALGGGSAIAGEAFPRGSASRQAPARLSALADERPLLGLCIAWVLLLPMLYFVVRGVPSYDHVEDVNGESSHYGFVNGEGGGSNAFTRIEMVLVYTVALGAMYPYLSGILTLALRNKMLVTLPALALISFIWSQDPVRTLMFGSSVVVLTLFPLYLTQRFSPQRQIELILFAGAAAIVLSYLLIAFVPSVGISSGYEGNPWNGLFSHKNHLGIIMTYMILTANYWKPKTQFARLSKPVFVLAALVLVVMSQSRTAWLLLACGAAVAVTLRYFKRFTGVQRVALLMLLVTVASTVAIGAVLYASQIGVLLGKNATLNGRTGIWAGIVPSALKRPMLGYGYDAFWLGLQGESGNFMYSTDHLGLANAENAVLQIWLELGLVGVGILFWILWQSCRNAFFCLRFDSSNRYVCWCVVIVALTLLTLVDGDKIMFPHTLEWVVYVMAYVGLSSEARRIRMQGPA